MPTAENMKSIPELATEVIDAAREYALHDGNLREKIKAYDAAIIRSHEMDGAVKWLQAQEQNKHEKMGGLDS